MIAFYYYLVLLNGTVTLGAALAVLWKSRHQYAGQVLGVGVVAFSIWLISYAQYFLPLSPGTAMIWAKITLTASFLNQPIILHGICAHVGKARKMRAWLILYYAIAVGLVVVLWTTNLVTGLRTGKDAAYMDHYIRYNHEYYQYLGLYYMSVVALGLGVLIRSAIQATGYRQTQLVYFTAAWAVVICTTYFVVVPIEYGIAMQPVGFFVLPINMAFLAYVLSKARLADYNVVIARVLLYVITLLVVVGASLLLIGGVLLVSPTFMNQTQVVFTVMLVLLIGLALTISLPRLLPRAERIMQERHYARDIVRAAAEKQLPSNQRIRGYQDSQLPTLEQRLFSTAPIYKSLEQVELAESLGEMQDVLGTSNADVQKALAGKSPDERAKELIEGTKLEDAAVRKQLYDGGQAAVDASTDPLIVLMRQVDPDARAVHNQDEDQVQSVLRNSGGNIGKALFADKGLSVPPDATFTLRLSYGTVEGYKLDGKNVPWFTTMGGAYEHAAKHGSEPPYQLPESWLKYKSVINLKTPFDTVSTPDIIGGNSGSPVINKAGEVVGIVFDGNIESLAWNFEYSDKVARAVEVDSRAIIESLKQIYHADALVNEITGTDAAAMRPHPQTKMDRSTPRQQ